MVHTPYPPQRIKLLKTPTNGTEQRTILGKHEMHCFKIILTMIHLNFRIYSDVHIPV
jgi:hypothetical protein